MTRRPGTVERAYELARSGDYVSAADIRKQLSKEGYGDAELQLTGRTITGELRRLCNEARANRPE